MMIDYYDTIDLKFHFYNEIFNFKNPLNLWYYKSICMYLRTYFSDSVGNE